MAVLLSLAQCPTHCSLGLKNGSKTRNSNPNIESLKAIAKFFSVTVDELLSTDEVLTIAEEDSKRKEKHFRNLVYGLLDICIALLLFLPFSDLYN